MSGFLLEHGRLAWLLFGAVPLAGAYVVGVLARGNANALRSKG